MKKRRSLPSKLGISLLLVTLILSVIGAVFVFEASVNESLSTFGDRFYLIKQHGLGLLVGWSALVVGLIVPSKWWIKSGLILYIAGLILLGAVFIPGIGLNLNGASRWISIGGLTLQPVELFKFGLVAYLAAWLSKKQSLLPFLLILAIPTLLLLMQPDMGSLLLILSISIGMFFAAGGNVKNIGLIGLVGIPILVVAIISSPYRLERITTFINPESDPLGSSFHVRQITIALGRGGLIGQGLGNSSQKYAYIPEASTDSIFAIIGEEVGFVGVSIIISIFLAYAYLGYRLVQRSQQEEAVKLLGLGILIWVSVQVLLNLSAVAALVPLTGVPLPLISYGRSSLIMVLFATGVLLRTGKHT